MVKTCFCCGQSKFALGKVIKSYSFNRRSMLKKALHIYVCFRVYESKFEKVLLFVQKHFCIN